MSTLDKIKTWIESEKHLPHFLRDFHDQKDFFKTFHKWAAKDKHYGISWSQAHIYAIDCFLKMMAYHGYTLQKTRKKIEFYDIESTLNEAWEKRQQQFAEHLNETLKNSKSD